MYISGYIALKLPKLHEILEAADTTDQCEQYGGLIEKLNRGGLKEPTDSLVYFTLYCYLCFVIQQDVQPLCKAAYVSYFNQINDSQKLLPVSAKKAASILANVFLNNWSHKRSAEIEGTDQLLKVAKLSASAL